MIETQAQKHVIDAVKAHGGAAHKLSNRFSVGVSDLLIKLPGLPAMLMEAKLDHRANVLHPQSPVMPDVTVPQHSFLTSYAEAGMVCGVMSFVEEARKGKRGLWLQVVRVPGFRPGDALRPDWYVQLAPLNLFDQLIVDALKECLDG